MSKRILAILAVLALTLACTPTVSFAEEWIEIYGVEDLYAVRNDLTANYKLMNDIDLSEATAPGGDYDFMGNGWNPIGSNNVYGGEAFSGVFDGDGHQITGLQIRSVTLPAGVNWGSQLKFGLFANVTGTVKNLSVDGLVNIYKSDDTSYPKIKAGSLAATVSGRIDNCSSACNVILKSLFHTYLYDSFYTIIGGLVGQVDAGTVTNCFFTGELSINILKYNGINYAYFGGLIGSCAANSVVTDCFSTADVTATSAAGGLVGAIHSTTLTNCYVTGKVSNLSDGSLYPGAFNYRNGGTVTNCYYLSTGGTSSEGAAPLTPAQMRLPASFVGFDFDNVWTIVPDATFRYPQLRSHPIDTENGVEAMTVSTLPAKLTYLEGKDSLNVSGGKLTITYKDGSSEVKSITRDMVSGFDNRRVGAQTLTVTYGRNTATFNVVVAPRSVAGIAVTRLPDKTRYIEGLETLDLTGGVLLLQYDNGTEEEIPLSGAAVTGFDNEMIGEQTLTASYGGFTASFRVEIVQKSVASIAVSTPPAKLDYVEGRDGLDLTGGVLQITYDNGTEDYIPLTFSMVSGFSNEAVGPLNLTVSYAGAFTALRVNIVARSAASLRMIRLPDKINYIEGLEHIAVTGGRMAVTYNNGTSEEVDLTLSMISGFDNGAVGTNTVTVTYKGMSTTFNVYIIPKSVAGVEVSRNPAKIRYLEGKDALDLTGGKILVRYNNNTFEEKDMTEAAVYGFDNSRVGSLTLTVEYEGFTASFQVQITAKASVSIEMGDLPAQLTYLEGKDTLNVVGGRIKVNYNNGSYVFVDLTPAMVSGFSNARVGKRMLTVTWNGLQTRFEVEIVAKSVASVAMSVLPGKLTYVEKKEDLEVTGGKLLVTYNNGDTAAVTLLPSMVAGFSNARAGRIDLDVTYEGKTTFFSVEILHDYGMINHPATCTEAGIREYVCAACGHSYTETGADPLGHKFTHYVSDGNADCTHDGTETAQCDRCDATHTRTEIGSAHGHSFGEWEVIRQPSGDQPGLKARTCSECGARDEKLILPAGKVSRISLSDADGVAGKEFTLDVTVENNPGVIAMAVELVYDRSVLELTDVQEVDFTGIFCGPRDGAVFSIAWEDAMSGNNVAGGVLARVTFRVKDGVSAASTRVSLQYDANNIFDAAFENVVFEKGEGTVRIRAFSPGDVNGDREVDLKDVALLKQYVNGWEVRIQEAVSDVNGDGKINLKDVALLKQYINGWDVVLK